MCGSRSSLSAELASMICYQQLYFLTSSTYVLIVVAVSGWWHTANAGRSDDPPLSGHNEAKPLSFSFTPII